MPEGPRAYPGGYYGYYGHVGTVGQEPGAYTTDTYVVVEPSWYDVAGGELLWAGVSRTLNPNGQVRLFGSAHSATRSALSLLRFSIA